MTRSPPLLALIGLLFVGCDGAVGTKTDSGAGTGLTTDSDPTQVVEGDTAPQNITVEVSEVIRTVARVRWTTTVETTGYVRFGEDGALSHQTPVTTSGTEHEVLLLGVPASTNIQLEVVTVGEPEVKSQTLTYVTGALPPELPTTTTTGAVTSWVGGFQVLPMQGSNFAITVIDDQGRFVWYDVLEPGYNLMRALLAADGSKMIYCLAGPQDNLAVGVIREVDLFTADYVDVPFPNVDHDFVELPDGTWAGIVVSEDGGVVFDRIVEMPAGGGDQVEVWSANDDALLTAHAGRFPQGTNFTHANALDYDPVEDAYYISLKNLGTIVKVDRASGTSEWHLNGYPNEFALLGDTPVVELAHQFQMLDDKVLIFDNGATSRGYSQVLEMDLDESALSVELLWSYRHDPDIYVFAKGDVERFEDGGTQVVWSSAGEIQNLDNNGQVIWQYNTDIGYAITFVQRVESMYGTR